VSPSETKPRMVILNPYSEAESGSGISEISGSGGESGSGESLQRSGPLLAVDSDIMSRCHGRRFRQELSLQELSRASVQTGRFERVARDTRSRRC
jgi:hypothetical protein